MEKEFEEMLKQHNTIIYKVARSYAFGDFQDLYQEIVYQIWVSFKNFKGQSKISTWIYRIALNTAITFKHEKKYKPVSLENASEPIAEIKGSEHDVTNEKIKRLYQAINQLKDDFKAVIILQLEGYDYEEIAQIIGISKSLVGVKINRAKNKLEQLLK